MVNGSPACSCPSFQFGKGKPCKHIQVKQAEEVFSSKAKPKYQTPQEKAIERSKAAKYGKAISPEVSKNPAYKTTEEKVAEDPELKQFMDKVS